MSRPHEGPEGSHHSSKGTPPGDREGKYVLERVNYCTCGNYRAEWYGHDYYCGIVPDYNSRSDR
jgi:hypothetical protein